MRERTGDLDTHKVEIRKLHDENESLTRKYQILLEKYKQTTKDVNLLKSQNTALHEQNDLLKRSSECTLGVTDVCEHRIKRLQSKLDASEETLTQERYRCHKFKEQLSLLTTAADTNLKNRPSVVVYHCAPVSEVVDGSSVM